jgi:ribosomal protein S18 acetylase RimI-like enzyme
VRVRRLEAHEAALLRDVRLRALREAPGAFATRFEEASGQPPEYWADMAERQVTFVAVEGDRAAGMVSVWPLADSPGSAWLARLWVDPAVRRSGAGLELVEAVAGWARERGMTTLELSVTANNAGATAFYASAGFSETGVRRPLPADPSRLEVFLTRAL